MWKAAPAAFCALSAILSAPAIQAQSATNETGQISGVVSIGGKPAQGILVSVSLIENTSPMRKPGSQATTDEGGRYKLTGLAPGRYAVRPIAPALTALDDADPRIGKPVALLEGETVDGIDFKLGRGGVITGRVTDTSGQPVVAERVTLTSIDRRGQKHPVYLNVYFMYETDDRGIYRLFGLAPGRYLVSVGFDTSGGVVRIGTAAGYYSRTFHPDVTDESAATMIELAEGGEATGVDIVVNRSSKTYTASGRIIDGETGRPVANIGYGYGNLPSGATSPSSFGWTSNRTDSKGEFRMEGVLPGRYAAFAVPEGESDFYSDPAPFEVTNSDVTGIEVKLRRGATISGDVVIEGPDDPELSAKISRLTVQTLAMSAGMGMPRFSPSRVAPDGTFRVSGLQPGAYSLRLGPMRVEEFAVVRVEREGMDVSRGIDVGPGEQIAGVRVVLAHGTGVIRGQVTFEGADPAKPIFAYASLRSAAELDARSRPPVRSPSTQVDARGRFLIERIPPGEYELSIIISGLRQQPAQTKKTVAVTNGAVVDVSFVINLKAGEKEDR